MENMEASEEKEALMAIYDSHFESISSSIFSVYLESVKTKNTIGSPFLRLENCLVFYSSP